MKFAIVPLVAMQDKMPCSAFRVLVALYSYANKDGVCWPSRNKLSERTHIKPPRISIALRELEKLGWITTKTGGGRLNNQYKIHTPSRIAGNDTAAITETTPPPVPKPACSGHENVPGAVTETTPVRDPNPTGTGHEIEYHNKPITDKKTQPLSNHGSRGSPIAEKSSQNHPPLGKHSQNLLANHLIWPLRLKPEFRQSVENVLVGIPSDVAQNILDELAGQLESNEIQRPAGYVASLKKIWQRSGQFIPSAGVSIATIRENSIKMKERKEKENDNARMEAKETLEKMEELNKLIEEMPTKILENHRQTFIENVKKRNDLMAEVWKKKSFSGVSFEAGFKGYLAKLLIS